MMMGARSQTICPQLQLRHRLEARRALKGFHRRVPHRPSNGIYFAIGGTSVSLPLISSKADFSDGLMCG
jgi:hypothetical protein